MPTISEGHSLCGKEPLYIIAHRCNSVGDVKDVVADQGLNAVEADFSYGAPTAFVSDRWVVDHDGVFSFSTGLDEWLDSVKEASSVLSLVIFDIKDPDGPLGTLYDRARAKLGSNINLLFSIGDYSSRAEFSDLKAKLDNDPRAGAAIDFLVGDDETQAAVQAFFQAEGIQRYWFGDGFNAATVTPQSVVENVMEGMALRDSNGASCGPNEFHGVYTWTYEAESTIRAFLNAGVNGIFINAAECFGRINPSGAWPPSSVVAYAKTLSDRKFATRSDNPFQRIAVANNAPVPVCRDVSHTTAADDALCSFAADIKVGVTDADGDAIASSQSPPGPYGKGSTAVTLNATDQHGAAASCTATVTVNDATPPTIVCPALLPLECTGPGGTAATFEATAVDNCPGLLTVESCSPPSGSRFDVSTTSVTCAARDDSGNRASCTFPVKVQDTTPPTLSVLGHVAPLECAVDAFVDPGARVDDTCDGSRSVIGTGAVNASVVGDYVVTYAASDAAGNLATPVTRSVSVVDRTAPSITCPNDITVEPESPQGTVVEFAAASWSDVCDTNLPVPTCPLSGSTFGVGTSSVVSCAVADTTSGPPALVSTCSLTVRVLSEEEVVEVLLDEVTALGANDTINGGQLRALTRHLQNILASIEKGRRPAACGKLRGFISQLSEWEADGILSPEEAAVLIGSAENLQATLTCTG